MRGCAAAGRVEAGRVDRARPGRRRVAGGRRRRPRRRSHPRLRHARGAGGRAHRRERAGRQGLHGTLPAGDVALGDRTNIVFQNTQVTRGTATLRRDRDRPGDPDGPHRRHGHRDQARALTAAARARRHDQDLRPARVDGGRDHRHRRHRAGPGHRDARSCCASRPRSPRSRSVCRRSCRRCCRRARSISPSRRRS